MSRVLIEVEVTLRSGDTEYTDTVEVTVERDVLGYLPFGQMVQASVNELIRKLPEPNGPPPP